MAGLDRRVTLTVRSLPTLNEFAEHVPAEVLFTGEVWADRRDLGTAQTIQSSPPFTVADATKRVYRLRWRADLEAVEVPRSQVTITEGARSFAADRVLEDRRADRRRFHLVEIDTGEA